MSQEVKDKLLCEITNVFTYYDTRISNLEKELEKHRNEISSLEDKCTDLINKNSEVKEELASFSKVSIIKSLNKSLLEKDGEIKFLESKLKNAKPPKDEAPQLLNEVKMIEPEPESEPQPEPESEPQPEPESEPQEEHQPEPESVSQESQLDNEEDNEEEVEVEFTIKKLRGKEYYVTDDADREIYEKLEDDEVGELVGKYNDKGRATFFKKKMI